jgi:hypothetical protein
VDGGVVQRRWRLAERGNVRMTIGLRRTEVLVWRNEPVAPPEAETAPRPDRSSRAADHQAVITGRSGARHIDLRFWR